VALAALIGRLARRDPDPEAARQARAALVARFGHLGAFTPGRSPTVRERVGGPAPGEHPRRGRLARDPSREQDPALATRVVRGATGWRGAWAAAWMVEVAIGQCRRARAGSAWRSRRLVV